MVWFHVMLCVLLLFSYGPCYPQISSILEQTSGLGGASYNSLFTTDVCLFLYLACASFPHTYTLPLLCCCIFLTVCCPQVAEPVAVEGATPLAVATPVPSSTAALNAALFADDATPTADGGLFSTSDEVCLVIISLSCDVSIVSSLSYLDCCNELVQPAPDAGSSDLFSLVSASLCQSVEHLVHEVLVSYYPRRFPPRSRPQRLRTTPPSEMWRAICLRRHPLPLETAPSSNSIA